MPREIADVSVIIPAYKAEATIGRALSSIASQTLMPAEIVIVDDGSNDNTETVIHRLRDELIPADVIYVKNPTNLGAGATRNRAIAEASKTYLAFLDADDEWLPKKLERSMDVMTESESTLVAHDYMNTESDHDVHIDCRARYDSHPDPYIALYLKGFIPSISVIAKRDAVLAVGGFDENLRNAQDFDLWLKLLAKPDDTFILFGEALARYHITPGSIMSHVERRISCCELIAQRYYKVIRARIDNPMAVFLKRIIFIQFEALNAYNGSRNWSAFALTAIKLPFRTVRSVLRVRSWIR